MVRGIFMKTLTKYLIISLKFFDYNVKYSFHCLLWYIASFTILFIFKNKVVYCLLCNLLNLTFECLQNLVHLKYTLSFSHVKNMKLTLWHIMNFHLLQTHLPYHYWFVFIFWCLCEETPFIIKVGHQPFNVGF